MMTNYTPAQLEAWAGSGPWFDMDLSGVSNEPPVRKRWHFYWVRPPMKPGYVRFYFGPFEIEKRPS